MKRRILYYLSIPVLLTIFMSASFLKENEIEKEEGFVLIQLFTSQGCSSCPSADELLNKVKSTSKEESIMVLSYHVDYWNRLGWKDPYSKKEYSDLQYAYGSKFGSGSVYTPQAVINGRLHFVGSNENKMNSNLQKFSKIPAENQISLKEVKKDDKLLRFNYEVAGDISDKYLKAAIVIDQRTTDVKSGENHGRKLINSNIVVKDIALIFNSSEGKGEISIPEIVLPNDKLRLVLYTQMKNLEITGATQAKVN